MTIINNLVISSSLGKTDCRRSRIYHEDNKIFAEHIKVPGELRTTHFVALPILIAAFASQEATEAAIARIVQAQEQMKVLVDITDLETDLEEHPLQK